MLSLYLTAAFLILNLKILNVSCHGNSSLVYVIDDTYSMHDDIRQVKIGSVQVLNDVLQAKSSEIANIVLVTFNDPDVRVRTVTKDPDEFKAALSSIHIYGGGDCPEYSLAGIIEGLDRSLPNSYMYVFTDASAKDYYRVKQVTDLCIKKQTQIIFLLTGHCGFPSSRQFRVYYDIATKCSGQVFIFDKQDVSQFLTSIKATINDPKSIVKTTTVPPNFFATPVRFSLDDKTDYAVISTSGKYVELAITRDHFGFDIATEQLMWTNSVKILKLLNTVPGDYVAWVKGASDVSVAIYAKTDFTFEHGFSEVPPKSLADTSKRPIADKNQHLSIQVTDPDNGVKIEEVTILSLKEEILMTMPLKHVDGSFYITDKFVSPKSSFIIQVKGTNKQSGAPIYRKSRTVIEPIDPIPEVVIEEKAPIVSISEGSQIAVRYNSNVVLRCRVSAYPEPTITWLAEDNTVLKSKNDVVDLPYDFISYLSLQNVTKSQNYVCRAKNKLRNKSSGIQVNVISPFEVISNLPATTNVKYKKPVTLNCGIKSDQPIKRVWFSDKAKELPIKGVNLDNYDENFVINSMDIDLQGRYGCKVWLVSDPRVFVEQHTILQIDDLSPPSITATQDISNKTFTASCLTQGTPKPTVKWYYGTNIKGTFSDLHVNGAVFKINNFNRNNFGIYKCIAENDVGKREENFNLVVEETPQILADKTKFIALVGDTVLEIPCNVTGYPDPTIVWKNIDNKTINSDSKYEVKQMLNVNYLYIRNPSLKDTSKFVCEASNKLGTASKIFETFVTDNFESDKNFYGPTNKIFILENQSRDMKCNLPHVDSKSVRWYKNGLLTDVVGTYYPIRKASASDDGNYTCRVNQEHGSVSATNVVKVGTKPTFETNYDASMILWSGDDNNFVDCTLKSSKSLDDHPKVEWLYNGKKSNIEGFKHPIVGWGQYTCKVSTDFGDPKRSINVTTDGCLIKRKVDFDNNPPLISSFNVEVESNRIINAVNKYMFMEFEQKMRILCHNSHDKNQFNIYPDEEYLIAECLGEDKFVINDQVYKYSDIKCEKPVEVIINNTNRTCTHDNSELIKIGFNINSGGFIETYKVCFDNDLKVPAFAYTEMSWHNLGNQVDYNKWVNIPSYQGMISTDCDSESKCCYGKEQLVNAADVTFGPPQAATFYDYNAVGVWKPCGNESRMSWQMIEENVRDLLDSNYNIQVWSGASGYEHRNIGMVPRYLWKAIESHGVIVYVNDPKPTEKDIKCSASIETLNRVLNAKDRFTYLCGFDEFSNVFDVPRSSFELI